MQLMTDLRSKQVRYILFMILMNQMQPLLGMKFEQLKECMINYGVANGYQLWYRNVAILCGRNVKEGRCSSQKGKQAEG